MRITVAGVAFITGQCRKEPESRVFGRDSINITLDCFQRTGLNVQRDHHRASCYSSKRVCQCSVAHRSGNSCGTASRRAASAKIHCRTRGLLIVHRHDLLSGRFISRPRKPWRCAGFIIRFNSVLEGYWSAQTWSVMRAVREKPARSLSLSLSLSHSLFLSLPSPPAAYPPIQAPFILRLAIDRRI